MLGSDDSFLIAAGKNTVNFRGLKNDMTTIDPPETFVVKTQICRASNKDY